MAGGGSRPSVQSESGSWATCCEASRQILGLPRRRACNWQPVTELRPAVSGLAAAAAVRTPSTSSPPASAMAKLMSEASTTPASRGSQIRGEGGGPEAKRERGREREMEGWRASPNLLSFVSLSQSATVSPCPHLNPPPKFAALRALL